MDNMDRLIKEEGGRFKFLFNFFFLDFYFSKEKRTGRFVLIPPLSLSLFLFLFLSLSLSLSFSFFLSLFSLFSLFSSFFLSLPFSLF